MTKKCFEVIYRIVMTVFVVAGFVVSIIALKNTIKGNEVSPSDIDPIESQIEEVAEEKVTFQINEVWVVQSTGMTYVDCDLDYEIQDYIFYMCGVYDLEFEMVMAQIKVESEYTVNAISPSGDYGLMQINKLNHEWLSQELGITDFLDAKQNVKAGMYVMRKLLDQCDGNVTLALMSYNMGCSGAKTLWDNGQYGTVYSDSVETEYMKLIGE